MSTNKYDWAFHIEEKKAIEKYIDILQYLCTTYNSSNRI